MPRSAKPQPKGPDWLPEQTLRVLRQQLEKLNPLKGRKYGEAHTEEELWSQVTNAALIHGFGEGSQNVTNFHFARSAGIHNLMGISEYQRQLNFNERIQEYEITVSSSIAELEASLPEAAVQGAYDAGDEYAFYKDLKDIVAQAKTGIFIVDNYLNTDFFELYVQPVGAGIPLRILTDVVRGNLETVARLYATSHTLELRSSGEVHDRHIFVDQRGWMVGQSIKDAAKKKPTYMVEISTGLVPSISQIYQDVWSRATVKVKS